MTKRENEPNTTAQQVSAGSASTANASQANGANAAAPQGNAQNVPSASARRANVELYSDGSSRGNPGPGGYGTILRYTKPSGEVFEREFSQGYRRTTNNRMELLGVIVGLEALTRPCSVDVYSDSQYVVKAFNDNWIAGWLKRGWKNASKQPVKNVDLWKRLLEAAKPHQVSYHWVRGHAGHEENERCDTLATTAADSTNLLEDEF